MRNIEKIESIIEFGGIKKDILFLSISAIFLIIKLLSIDILPFDPSWIAIILCGLPIVIKAIIALITEFDIKADILVSIALIAAIIIDEKFAAGEVAFIMQFGTLLEDITVSKAKFGIEKLINLSPKTARLIKDNEEKIIPVENIKLNDILKVLPGESIAVDGIIISGQTSINQSVMTGEAMPVDKTIDDEVMSGTINQFGVFTMMATKVGENSSIQKMIKLVESADAGRAKIVSIADKWATYIVIIALLSAFLTWFFTGEIIRAVTILVVFCPCALVLATPTAIMAAIGNATKYGFLIQKGDALERLASVNKVTFDKTGTLTYGKPKVISFISLNKNFSNEDIFLYAASLEQNSEHPLGKAILKSYREKFSKKLLEVKNFNMIIGKGISGEIFGDKVLVGNIKMMKENNIDLTSDIILESSELNEKKSNTLIYISINNSLVGYITLDDIIRNDAKSTIENLKSINISSVLLTGDNQSTALAVASELNINEFNANCLPEDKMNWISDKQDKQEKICMIGDGINDAPALKKANVGIAMGGIGSDITIDAADITLVNDDIRELPHLFSLSKKMMSTIKYNLIFSLILNFLAIILAMQGILNPIFGALIHNAGSIFVIINSALLLKWSSKN